jgi:peptide methionine sulfoxide reductase MsrA
MTSPEGYELATVAAGCFWGVEHMFRKEFKGKGLHDARVGYIGGDTESPSYRAVCSGNTGRTFCSFLDIEVWRGTLLMCELDRRRSSTDIL